MSEKTKILILGGMTGAGKTKLLKKIIKEYGKPSNLLFPNLKIKERIPNMINYEELKHFDKNHLKRFYFNENFLNSDVHQILSRSLHFNLRDMER